MRKFFITIFILFSILAATASSYAIDLQKMMHDSLARGYFEASQGNRIQSKKHFRKAFDLARKTQDWSVMIDSAGGLLALGEREDATEYFDRIANLNKGMKDWRASVALAYNYLSYPKDFIENEKAAKSLEDAIKYASEKNDWRGLVETSKVLYDTKSKERALECLESAKSIGMKSKNYEAMAEIASSYKKMGESQKSQETIRLYEEYKGQFGQISAYPENFNPYGETVAAPKKINTENQIAERESADKEITAKIDYLAKLSELDKKEKDYYLTYNYYYDYPYYRRFYSNYGSVTYLPPDWLGEWANFHLRHYRLINGNYLFLGW